MRSDESTEVTCIPASSSLLLKRSAFSKKNRLFVELPSPSLAESVAHKTLMLGRTLTTVFLELSSLRLSLEIFAVMLRSPGLL